MLNLKRRKDRETQSQAKINEPIKRFVKHFYNKTIIWKDSETGKGHLEVIKDIIIYGVLLNAAVWVITRGWFSFNIFTIIGWGCVAHFIYEYPKYWIEEIMQKNQ